MREIRTPNIVIPDIDLWDLLWKPRLVANSVISAVQGIGKNRNPKRFYLKMDEHAEEFCYPRPQMERDSFFSLNGEWNLTLGGLKRQHKIRVPFPPQAARSGMDVRVGDCFSYHRKFELTEEFLKGKSASLNSESVSSSSESASTEINSQNRILLHFGAVDQVAKVWLNGILLGEHEGGYLPFTFDVTDVLARDFESGSMVGQKNELLVQVKDALDHKYPYGKQSRTPGGMWYPQISGIWQTVWMESVPASHVDKVVCSTVSISDAKDGRQAIVDMDIQGTEKVYELVLRLPDGRVVHRRALNGKNRLEINCPKLWTPQTPYLYRFELHAGADIVRSYFAIRTITIEEAAGRQRLCLNHKPYFFHGVLDQGYYSDGLWTPPSYKWYERDIRDMKELGFNTLRMHIKVEAARFYYDCDRLGMVVFQDMVNNGSYNYLRDTVFPTVAPFYMGHRKKDTNLKVAEDVKQFFIRHSKDTIEYLKGFPCVLYYTVFNEGWGQFDSDAVTNILRKVDPTRIYDSTSGWYTQKKSDVNSLHYYFHKVKRLKWKKPVVISEFGGFLLFSPEHSAFREGVYGYGACLTEHALTNRILRMYREEIIPLMKDGICATIYTQLSDVETELNGLYTYNRKNCKVEKERMQKLARHLRYENARFYE